MGKFFRISAWLLLVIALTWGVVIAYWQIADVRPDGRDVALYLGVLPLAAFAILALGKRGYDAARRKAAAQAAIPEAEAPLGDTNTAAKPVTPSPSLAILETGLSVAAGTDATNVLAALAATTAPILHDKLRDSRGFPVFAAWDRQLDIETVAQHFDALDGSLRPDEEQTRALALLMPMAMDLFAMIASEHWPPDPAPNEAPGTAVSPRRLQVSLFLPSDWPEALSASVRDWLADEARAVDIASARLAIEVLPTTSAAAVWQRISSIAGEPADATMPVLHLLLACHSLIGARSVRRLDQSGQLLSARQPEGLVPGEGAAGVLLLAADVADRLGHRPRAALRAQVGSETGAQSQTRTASHEIVGQLQALFALAPDVRSDALQAVISDSDLRRNRSAALGTAVLQAVPHLDIEHDLVRTGVACGELGIVSPLALIALAAAKAERDHAPTVAMAVAEAHRRTFALVTSSDSPAMEPADASPPTPQAT